MSSTSHSQSPPPPNSQNEEECIYEPDTNSYLIMSMLGQCCGDVGKVYLAFHVPSKTPIALKQFNVDKIKDEMENIQNEIILTRQLRHPNVVMVSASFVLQSYVTVISPLMAFGSCRDLLNRHFTEGLPELAISYILKDILQALDYIHRKGYVHRAVRASHILVNANGEAVLSGLRYACRLVKNGRWQRSVHSFPTTSARNLNWLSPELLEQNLQGYNEKSDMYSLGVTACELANGVAPFQDHPPTLMLTEKVRGYAPVLLDCTTCPQFADTGQQNSNQTQAQADSGVGDSVGSNGNSLEGNSLTTRRFTDHFHRFAELCLQRDPENRPSASQLLGHSFFKLPRRMNAPPLPQLLHPVIPLTKEVLGLQNYEEFQVMDRFGEMDLNSCEWDF
ncbi:hypothetical protein ONE63_008279 [Megalurothrips usitatus]|uniref:Protein kinase domain-containing protein n=1 Tax=Megalurothrips usitatus TaxID=439358 RepID=A0AAV7XN62_9NEOP|nr:hypothetical protein ONE63_008279 [Megalurothrips usitatus]